MNTDYTKSLIEKSEKEYNERQKQIDAKIKKTDGVTFFNKNVSWKDVFLLKNNYKGE